MSPRFSVIMISCNQARYVRCALASLRQSGFADWEAICVDDGSTDDTVSALRAAADGDARITVLPIAHSGKPSIARNAALRHARGEYLCFIDGDDLVDRERLTLLDAAITAGGADVLFHDYADFADGTNPVEGRRCLAGTAIGAELASLGAPARELVPGVRTVAFDGNALAGFLVGRSFVINTGTVCIRREHFFARVPGFPTDRVMGEDTVTWLRCIVGARVTMLDATLSFWRKYAGSVTSVRDVGKQREIVQSLREMRTIIRDISSNAWRDAAERRLYEERVDVGVLLEQSGQRVPAALDYVATAFEFRALNPMVRAAKALVRSASGARA